MPTKNEIIAHSLSTPYGQWQLAQAMVAPIRRALNYSSIGQKLFMVDELPQGAYANYEIATNPTFYVGEPIDPYAGYEILEEF